MGETIIDDVKISPILSERARARARARARTALVKRGASGPCPKKCLAFFPPARASFPLLKIAIFGDFHLKSAQNNEKEGSF